MAVSINNIKQTYSKIEPVELISSRLDTFAQLEHIDQLKNYFLHKIASFAARIDEFLIDINQMQEAVRALDESLSVKANKSGLVTFEDKINRKFISHDEYGGLKQDH